VQENRGADERPRRRREELSETEAANHGRTGQGRSRSSGPSVGRMVRAHSRPDRVLPMRLHQDLGGYSLLELMMVMGLGATLTAAAVPQYLNGLDDVRAKGAAHHLAARLQNARMEAVKRSAMVGVQFTQTETGAYSYAVYLDGNRNGVLTRDIQKGV